MASSSPILFIRESHGLVSGKGGNDWSRSIGSQLENTSSSVLSSLDCDFDSTKAPEALVSIPVINKSTDVRYLWGKGLFCVRYGVKRATSTSPYFVYGI